MLGFEPEIQDFLQNEFLNIEEQKLKICVLTVREQYMLSTTNNQHHLTFAFRDLVKLIHDEGCCFCVRKKSK